jgi:glutamine amidotransferase PdxT
MGTSFHPELTGDARVHDYFLHLLTANAKAA